MRKNHKNDQYERYVLCVLINMYRMETVYAYRERKRERVGGDRREGERGDRKERARGGGRAQWREGDTELIESKIFE